VFPTKYVFGPVPSRRLGRSLGVNNIPPKHCTYSCTYCQIGRTINLEVSRKEFYPWRDIVEEVVEAVKSIGENNLDYVTFVPDGEPTLDINLGKEIGFLKKKISTPIAVLTNGSLLFLEEVRNDLYEADTVSVKVDAFSERVFRKINRPHPGLRLKNVLEGMAEFSKSFKGKLLTETMVVNGLNDDVMEMENVAKFIAKLNPFKTYIAIPTRPPAEEWVKQPSEQRLFEIYKVFEKHLPGKVELLIGYEGADFRIDKRKPVESILSITSVHPMRIDYAAKLLEKAGLNPYETLEKLKRQGKIVILKYGKYEFVMRKIHPIRK